MLALQSALVENTKMKRIDLWTVVFKNKHLVIGPGAEVQGQEMPAPHLQSASHHSELRVSLLSHLHPPL